MTVPMTDLAVSNCSFSNLRGEALWNCRRSTTHTSKWFQKRALEVIWVSCDFSLSTEGEVSLFWSWNNKQINRRIIYSSRFSKNNAFFMWYFPVDNNTGWMCDASLLKVDNWRTIEPIIRGNCVDVYVCAQIADITARFAD